MLIIMECIKCKKLIDDDFTFCPYCGKKQIREKKPRRRGNGQGTVYKDGNRYRAIVTIGYYLGEDGKLKRKTKSQRFDTKKEAIASLPVFKTSLSGNNVRILPLSNSTISGCLRTKQENRQLTVTKPLLNTLNLFGFSGCRT